MTTSSSSLNCFVARVAFWALCSVVLLQVKYCKRWWCSIKLCDSSVLRPEVRWFLKLYTSAYVYVQLKLIMCYIFFSFRKISTLQSLLLCDFSHYCYVTSCFKYTIYFQIQMNLFARNLGLNV